MHEKESRNVGPSFFLGLGVIIVGALLLLERFGYVDSDRLFDYWPLILVFVGVNKLIYGRDRGARVFGGLVGLIGMGFLLQEMGFIILEWNLIFPIALIGLGVYLVLRSRGKPRASARDRTMSPSSMSGRRSAAADSPTTRLRFRVERSSRCSVATRSI